MIHASFDDDDEFEYNETETEEWSVSDYTYEEIVRAEETGAWTQDGANLTLEALDLAETFAGYEPYEPVLDDTTDYSTVEPAYLPKMFNNGELVDHTKAVTDEGYMTASYDFVDKETAGIQENTTSTETTTNSTVAVFDLSEKMFNNSVAHTLNYAPAPAPALTNLPKMTFHYPPPIYRTMDATHMPIDLAEKTFDDNNSINHAINTTDKPLYLPENIFRNDELTSIIEVEEENDMEGEDTSEEEEEDIAQDDNAQDDNSQDDNAQDDNARDDTVQEHTVQDDPTQEHTDNHESINPEITISRDNEPANHIRAEKAHTVDHQSVHPQTATWVHKMVTGSKHESPLKIFTPFDANRNRAFLPQSLQRHCAGTTTTPQPFFASAAWMTIKGILGLVMHSIESCP
jgi:hypothetical protein